METRKVGTRPAPSRHRSPTLPPTVRGHRHSPNTVSRCRKICRAHHPSQLVCKHRCNRELNVTKLPATSHRHSPTLSQTLRRRGHRPTTASRCSRVGRVDLPRQHADQHRHDRIPNVSKLPGSHAASRHRSPALSHGGAWQPAQSHHRFFMVESLSYRTTAPTVCKRPCVPGYRRSANCPSPPRHHTESNDTCAPVRVATSRVDRPATCWPTCALAP